MATLSVHLVSWNGAKYVPALFDSLKNQTFTDWELVIWDNASSDDMVQQMNTQKASFSVPVHIHEHDTNIGFAGGHNALFKQTTGKYILLLNQDMYLQRDTFEKLVVFLNEHPEYDAVSPRLMRWNFAQFGNAGVPVENVFTTYVDALGLQVFPNRRVIDQYTAQHWNTLKDTLPKEILPVFGLSGALPLFRTQALCDVAFSDGTMFDELYESYKEDVDLAFRMASAGKKSAVLLSAIAYHDRSAAGPKERSDRAAAANKKKQSRWVKYHSYKNHLITLYKNEYWQNGLLDGYRIVWYEGKKFVFILLTNPTVLKGLWVFLSHVGAIHKRRKEIRTKRMLSWKEIRMYWAT